MSNGWHVDNNVCARLFAQLRVRPSRWVRARCVRFKNNLEAFASRIGYAAEAPVTSTGRETTVAGKATRQS